MKQQQRRILPKCENCGHSLVPNDWIGVCSVSFKTGCRWCLEKKGQLLFLSSVKVRPRVGAVHCYSLKEGEQDGNL